MAKRKDSDLEVSFMRAWKLVAGDDWPRPRRQHRFHPTRKWLFDFAWEAERVAVELEGGVFSFPVTCDSCGRHVHRKNKHTKRMERVYAAMGRHTRGAGFQADCDKYNAATALGWRVLRYTAKHLAESPVQMVEQIQKLLAEGRKAEVETQGDLFEPVSVRDKTKELFR